MQNPKSFSLLSWNSYNEEETTYPQMVDQAPWWLVLREQVLSPGRMCGQPSVFGQVNMLMFQVFRQKQKRDDSFQLNR